jgi:glucose uptake protein
MLPNSYEFTLLLLLVSMVCWGSWANTTKLTGKWPFELFYFDYAFGVLLLATIAAFTLGEMSDGLGFQDNLFLISWKRYWLLAFAGGMVFNLANMLLVAAIQLTGLSVAFPIGIGLAMIVGVAWNYVLRPQGNPLFLFGGAVLVLMAIVLDALAYRGLAAHKAKGKAPKSSTRGIVIALVSGILMGSFYPLVEMSSADALRGLTPYGAAFLFSIGVFVSTFLYSIYFMNLPVTGQPVEALQYFRGSFKQHALGWIGGILWCIGAVTNFVAAKAQGDASVGPAVSYALGQGATMVSVMWGLVVWQEFKGAPGKVWVMLTGMFLLFGAGLGMIAAAPLFGR